jgi:uncharacterized membrane protein YoaK (UPF0700 family)
MPFQHLPPWIQLGAFFLAVNAGMINVLGLVTVLHQSVSHMTGNVSVLAMSLVHWQPESILYLLLVTVCYVIGSFYSGVILGNSHFRLGRRYGVPLTLVAFYFSVLVLSALFSTLCFTVGLRRDGCAKCNGEPL